MKTIHKQNSNVFLDVRKMFPLLSTLNIGSKLTIGFGIVVSLTLLVSALSYWASIEVTSSINRTESVRLPTTIISANAHANLLEMIAAVHGYLALGNPEFRHDYELARQRFESNLVSLEQLADSWNNSHTSKHLNELQNLYKEWSQLPQQMFLLRNNQLQREPALRLLIQEGQPLIRVITLNTVELMEQQSQREASAETVDLLRSMASFQGSFTAMVSGLRGYVTTGRDIFKFEYTGNLSINATDLKKLTNRQLRLNTGQKVALAELVQAREDFLSMSERMLGIVEGDQARQDLFLFETQAKPIAEKMQMLLQSMTNEQQTLLQLDLGTGKNGLSTAQWYILIVGALAVVFGTCMSILFWSNITAPVYRLIRAVERTACGDLDHQAQVESADEIGKLAQAFNYMVAQLKEARHALEARIADLQSALIEIQTHKTQLALAMNEAQDARAVAEQANHLKSQFLANMSHELRTPLNSIINFTRLMSSGVCGPVTNDQADYLNRVRVNGEHLLGMINDILDLSKIEAGRMDIHLEPCGMNELVQGTLSTAVGLIKGKPIELIADVSPNLPIIEVDRTRIRQVLLNLLSNAAKFTEAGSITVQVQRADDTVIISVIDTDIGIAAEKFDLIFEEFRQVDGGSNRSYQGTGLGLSICKHFVEMHGGCIWVESTVGVGSTFSFSLPIKVSSHQVGPMETIEPTQKDGIPILVIDDDDAAIDIIASYLENDGYTVYSVTDSRKALDEVQRIRPAVVILDILMPYKDGWEILTAIKTDTQFHTIPVVLYSMLEEQRLGFSRGANAYLTKPIHEQHLRTTMQSLVVDGAQVVVIDDDPNMLQSVTQQLKQISDLNIMTASGGKAGLDLIAQTQPDLIILDLIMPEVDGFAVLEELDRQPHTRSIPVTVLTAQELTEDEHTFLTQRVGNLLSKNMLTPDLLPGKVHAILSNIRQSLA